MPWFKKIIKYFLLLQKLWVKWNRRWALCNSVVMSSNGYAKLLQGLFQCGFPLFNKTCATWMWLLWIFKGAIGLSCIRYGPPTQQHFFIVGKSNLQSASTSYYVLPYRRMASNQILGRPYLGKNSLICLEAKSMTPCQVHISFPFLPATSSLRSNNNP